MYLTEEEKQQFKRWITEAENHASVLTNEWLIGLYTGEAMGYKIMLRLSETEER